MNSSETHLLDSDSVRTYVLAGKAVFTVLNTRTGNRFTFRVNKGKRSGAPHFVSVLTGSDNNSSYSYAGAIFDATNFRWTRKSRLFRNAQSVLTFSWFWSNLDRLPEFIEVYHHNHCGRCGRLLTVPESITNGVGPVCAGRAA